MATPLNAVPYCTLKRGAGNTPDTIWNFYYSVELSGLGGFNDSINAIEVAAGAELTIYTDGGWKGISKTYKGPIKVTSMPAEFIKKISSIKLKTPSDVKISVGSAASNGAIFDVKSTPLYQAYQKVNFVEPGHAVSTAGLVDPGKLGAPGADTDSIKIAPYTRVTLYRFTPIMNNIDNARGNSKNPPIVYYNNTGKVMEVPQLPSPHYRNLHGAMIMRIPMPNADQLKCCKGDSGTSAGTCSQFWRDGDSRSCDTIMTNYCKLAANKTGSLCSCFNSEIPKPQCYDTRCTSGGFKTVDMRKTDCSGTYFNCNQYLTLSPGAKQNLLSNVGMAQKCGEGSGGTGSGSTGSGSTGSGTKILDVSGDGAGSGGIDDPLFKGLGSGASGSSGGDNNLMWYVLGGVFLFILLIVLIVVMMRSGSDDDYYDDNQRPPPRGYRRYQ